MPENREIIINSPELSSQPQNFNKEITNLVDIQKDKESPVPREVKTWMQKLEEDPSINNNQNSNTNDDLAMKQIVNPKIVLPTTRKTFTGGFSQTSSSPWRWLSEFVLRIIKKNQGKVKFKEE